MQLLDAKIINSNYEDKPVQLALPQRNVFIYQDNLEYGMDSVPDNDGISMTQNPVDNTLTIADKKESIKHIRLSNSLGQILLEQFPIKQNRHVVMLTNLPSGVYVISLIENNELKTKAFTVTR